MKLLKKMIYGCWPISRLHPTCVVLSFRLQDLSSLIVRWDLLVARWWYFQLTSHCQWPVKIDQPNIFFSAHKNGTRDWFQIIHQPLANKCVVLLDKLNLYRPLAGWQGLIIFPGCSLGTETLPPLPWHCQTTTGETITVKGQPVWRNKLKTFETFAVEHYNLFVEFQRCVQWRVTNLYLGLRNR